MKTYTPKAKEITQAWHHIDAEGKILGRVSTEIAQLLTGKNKPYFVPHLDCGDYVVVTNIDKIQVTGQKLLKKTYYHHTGYPGGLKEEKLKDRLERNPLRVLEASVKGMLPKNKLRDPRMRRLKAFAGDQHPYADKLQDKSK